MWQFKWVSKLFPSFNIHMSCILSNAIHIKGHIDLLASVLGLHVHRRLSPQDNLVKHYFWLNMGDNSGFESVGVCTWTSWMIWMPVLTFSLAFLSWFADFKLFVSSGHFLIIMLGNWHGSTISGKGPLLLCNYPLWVCKAFFVFDRYFNIFLGYVKANFVSMDIMLVHCIFCP